MRRGDIVWERVYPERGFPFHREMERNPRGSYLQVESSPGSWNATAVQITLYRAPAPAAGLRRLERRIYVY